MALVAVAWPGSEPESAAMVCLLQANEIPCFVRGGAIAAMVPGLQIGAYNTPAIMVPEGLAQSAAELLSVFSTHSLSSAQPQASVGFLAKLRMVFEVILFGRFVSQPVVREDHEDGT